MYKLLSKFYKAIFEWSYSKWMKYDYKIPKKTKRPMIFGERVYRDANGNLAYDSDNGKNKAIGVALSVEGK